jgi:hypothetical protein
MKRILVLLTVMALMVVMVAMSVAPAFALGPPANVNVAWYRACNPPGAAPLWCE